LTNLSGMRHAISCSHAERPVDSHYTQFFPFSCNADAADKGIRERERNENQHRHSEREQNEVS
jgi:hypothetical protein